MTGACVFTVPVAITPASAIECVSGFNPEGTQAGTLVPPEQGAPA